MLAITKTYKKVFTYILNGSRSTYNCSKLYLKTSQTLFSGSSHSPAFIIYINNLIIFFTTKFLSGPDRRSIFYIKFRYSVENGSSYRDIMNGLPGDCLKTLVYSQLHEGVDVLEESQKTIEYITGFYKENIFKIRWRCNHRAGE